MLVIPSVALVVAFARKHEGKVEESNKMSSLHSSALAE